MDSSDDTTADLSPLEQRRMRLRAFADRVLEAVEALPMPKTALDGERTLRAVTACDRMLIQIYSRVTPLQQQPITHPIGRSVCAPVTCPATASVMSNPMKAMPEATAEAEDNAPFVYRFDDDGVDELPEDAAEALEPEPVSEAARTALDLERRANEIFAKYLAAIAEDKENAGTDPP
ncbi:MAG: hypothetical protein QM647_11030 [Asticcacaulis sp.]|uniref:hypothetical protein n=1 Tax=Asticcacaulis sp. TaxID=1872648 RepID=UPI0039E5F7DF